MVSLQQASELVRETEGQSSAADVAQHWILAGQQCSSDSTLPFFCPQRACMAEEKENLCRKLFVVAVESDSDAPEHIHILYFIYIYIYLEGTVGAGAPAEGSLLGQHGFKGELDQILRA